MTTITETQPKKIKTKRAKKQADISTNETATVVTAKADISLSASTDKPSKRKSKVVGEDVDQPEEKVVEGGRRKKAKKGDTGASQPAEGITIPEDNERKKKEKKRAGKKGKAEEVVVEAQIEQVKESPALVNEDAEQVAMAEASEVTSKKKKGKKGKKLPVEDEKEDDDDEKAEAAMAEIGADSSDDEDVHLHGFSTDDDDSSDEDAMNDEAPAFDVGKLPTVAKDDAVVKKRLEKAKRQPTEDRGVLYLGRIPHGFYEDQLRAYFSQFGDITRLRLSRNKKTGQSKHYGFIEFDSSSVAQIVAETMDNYLLMGHILRCKIIPKDEVHPELWVGANRKWRVIPRDRISRVQHNKPRTEEEREKAEHRLIKRQNEKKRKLEEAGIKYNFEAISYKKRPKGVDA